MQVGADRCTVFEVDNEKNEIFSRVALGLEAGLEIRLPKTRGATGFVTRTEAENGTPAIRASSVAAAARTGAPSQGFIGRRRRSPDLWGVIA